MWPKVSVIIVNWNGIKHLKACLESVNNQTYNNYEIIFVDNGSTDNSLDFVEKKYPNIKLIKLNENKGFATGNNIAIKKSFEDVTVEYIACINNDTKVDENWLLELLKAVNNKNGVGMCQSKILFMSNEKIHSTGILLYKDLTTTNRGMFEKDEGQYDNKVDIFGPIGCGALYKRSMLEKIDLGEGEFFDNDYFAYREDDDIAWRGRLAGFKCIFVPKSIVYHVHSATSKVKSPFKIYHTERNRIFNIIKISPWDILVKSVFFSIKRFYFVLLVSNGPKSELAKVNTKSIFINVAIDAIKKFPKMLKKRRIIKKTIVISQAEQKEFFDKYAVNLLDLY